MLKPTCAICAHLDRVAPKTAIKPVRNSRSRLLYLNRLPLFWSIRVFAPKKQNYFQIHRKDFFNDLVKKQPLSGNEKLFDNERGTPPGFTLSERVKIIYFRVGNRGCRTASG